jgi:predicted NBD/HSP70 family sugar kinase
VKERRKGDVSVGSLGSLRELNRLRVVDALRRRGTASRTDLARLTGLSRTTVATVVADLQARGLVVDLPDDQAQPPATGRGRPPMMLRLDASAGAALGIDFGHTHLRVAVADLSSAILAERVVRLDVDGDAATALDAAASLAEEALTESGVDRSRLVGAGMGLPGPIDRRTGEISSSVILPGWRGLRPGHELARRLNVHVEVDNDANVGALGEVSFGAGRGFSDVVYVKVGSGIGAGLVLDGRLYHGATGIAGELGHVPVRPDGAVCTCGNRGCLQTVAAVGPVVAALRPAHGPDLTIRGVAELVAAGDVAASRVVNDAGRMIGRVLADLCNHLNPAAIIVGGELSTTGPPLLAGIREAVDRYALPGAAQAAEIRAGVLGERAELLGALALVIADTERLRSAGFASLHEPFGARASDSGPRATRPRKTA